MNTKFAMPFKFLLIVIFLNICNAQRVVPGVNPQHYQQVPVQQQQQYQQQHPPPQQYQQQQQVHHAPGVAPQHYQQQNVQYQQVPAQQQQQVPVQQQHQQQQQQQHPPAPQVQQQVHPGQQQHHGHHPPQQVLNAANIEHERAHIQEHMQVPIDTSKMSEAELQFHYFKMHDSDNNNKLDGCELIKSLIHWHVKEKPKLNETDGNEEHDTKIYTDKELSDVIDYVLNTMDKNRDGFVDYAEYREGEESAAKGTGQ
ncbi:signal transducer and activator of transcription C isoform X2 [Teleopsis dalmanni]|uniref:signal transducer and activator of transcription C isoform X2 n=1 Tax=Teleopsis dalmanni TaxID=139649 RepID=UPI0018CEF804|nr:signal transducer and activator of transcription C isoform X2 [Teleopsis dalmanni]